MALNTIIPSKHVSEVHQLLVDFSTLLISGESILPLTVAVTIGVYSGVDPNPTALLVPSPSIIGNVVSQGLQQGVIGVVYFLDVTATTTLGHTYHIESKLAILEDNYPAGGAFIHYYFTSQPYPIQVIDNLHFMGSVVSCLVNLVERDYSFSDTTHWTSSIPSALVTGGTYPYAMGDSTHWISGIISANVLTTLITYAGPTEATHWTAAVVSATVTTTLISYTYTEATHWTSSIQSATVT